MISEAQRLKIMPWLPAGFCAFLSLLTICSNLYQSSVNRTDVGGWAVVFLNLLPMCFVFAGSAIWQLQREIADLRKQVAELREKEAGL